MRRLVMSAFAGIMMASGGAQAQQGRYEGPLPMEYEWELGSINEGSINEGWHDVMLRFRNTSGFTSNGFWTLTGFWIEYPPARAGECDGPCDFGWGEPGLLGSVDTRDLGSDGYPLLFHLSNWGAFEGPYQGGPMIVGPASGALFEDNLGLLGCAVPRNRNPDVAGVPLSDRHTGRTCAQAGYSGWVGVSLFVAVPTGESFQAGQLRIDPIMEFVSAAVVPTPASLPLLAAGVLGLLARASRGRRRRWTTQ